MSKSKYANKYVTVHDYFDNMDTPEKWMHLGLLVSDGNVRKVGNEIQITFKADGRSGPSNLKILKNVRTAINPDETRPIYEASRREIVPTRYKSGYVLNSISLRWGSKHMKETLISYGVTPDKSKTFVPNFPEFGTEENFRGLIIGVLNGDGCITGCFRSRRGKKDKVKEYKVKFVTASPEFAQWLVQEIATYSGFTFGVCGVEVPLAGNKQIEAFLTWLFKDLEHLVMDYKYEQYKQLVERFEYATV